MGEIFRLFGKILIFPIVYFLLFYFQGLIGLLGFYIGKVLSIFTLPVVLFDTFLYDVAPYVLFSSTILSIIFAVWRSIHLIRKILSY